MKFSSVSEGAWWEEIMKKIITTIILLCALTACNNQNDNQTNYEQQQAPITSNIIGRLFSNRVSAYEKHSLIYSSECPSRVAVFLKRDFQVCFITTYELISRSEITV